MDTPMTVTGHNGQLIFDGRAVTITRRGYIARATVGKGEKRIHVADITAVQFKPAGPFAHGFIEFSLGGGQEGRSVAMQQNLVAIRNENAVMFRRSQQHDFERIRLAIQAAVDADRSGGQLPGAGPDIAVQLQQLAALHASGALTTAEYDAAKSRLLQP